jgi:hypothetical protein
MSATVVAVVLRFNDMRFLVTTARLESEIRKMAGNLIRLRIEVFKLTLFHTAYT